MIRSATLPDTAARRARRRLPALPMPVMPMLALPMLFLSACTVIPASTPRAAAPAPAAAMLPMPPAGFRALGTEPFWNVALSRESLALTTPEIAERRASGVTVTQGADAITASGVIDGRPVTLVIRPGQCGDGMSDRSYPYSATLSFDGAVERGCAFEGDRPPEGPG